MDRLAVMRCPPGVLACSLTLHGARAIVQLRLHAMALVPKRAAMLRPRRVTSMMPNGTGIAARPIMPAMEERAVPVVPRPVDVHRKRDDRNVHLAGIDRQQHTAVMVKKLQVICIDPAAKSVKQHKRG